MISFFHQDLWNTSHGAANSATGFYSAAGSYGYENNNLYLHRTEAGLGIHARFRMMRMILLGRNI